MLVCSKRFPQRIGYFIQITGAEIIIIGFPVPIDPGTLRLDKSDGSALIIDIKPFVRIILINGCPLRMVFSASFHLDFDMVNGALLAGDWRSDSPVTFCNDVSFNLNISPHSAGFYF